MNMRRFALIAVPYLWLLSLFFLPYITVPLYFVFG